ncbi:Ig-like domain-containing protein [Polaribacter vadi]|uniref:Ig-like domain-containing protein n=1 Tax=Polaribacter vadi TaxID=1774273 RepID=UPI0030EB2232|tara:strand:+ start:4386 stop:7430 length:3045 start_codon:yes stop_codon:yes gene_type:complete
MNKIIFLKSKYLILLLLIFTFQTGFTQNDNGSIDVAGDIAFVAYHDDLDGFSFIFLDDCPANTIISFIDDEWLGSDWAGISEGELVWQNNSGGVITKGTVIDVTNADDRGDGISATAGSIYENDDEDTPNYSGFNTSSSNSDEIYAIAGRRSNISSTFLAFVGRAGTSTLTGTGLINGTTAHEFSSGMASYSEGYYTGTTNFSGSLSTVAATINSSSNWTSGSFTFPGSVPNSFSGSTFVNNTAPVIAGTLANQAVNDNSTLSPFSSITATDADGNNLSATITLDNNAKGILTGTGLTGTGPYAIASTTPADLQAKLKALSFNPTDNRTSTSETTTLTVEINDGTDTDTDNTTTVISSAVAPTLSSSSPADNTSNIVISSNIVLTFNENISKGTSGNITIKKTLDDSTVETIAVTSGLVTVTTNQATINPTSDLDLNTEYYILIDNTAFKDAGDKNYAGISSTTSLSFTTEANQTNSYTVASGIWSVSSNWSLNRLPISTDNVNIGTNTINLNISNVTVNDLSISIGGALNILFGQSITVNGNLNQNGTLNMLSNASNNASLIVKGNHTGISTVDYHRYLSTNWHLIGAPISGKNITDFSGNVNTNENNYAIAPYVNNVVSDSRWNYYTTAAGSNNIASAETFAPGKGYSIQKSTSGTLNFSGTLNTTNINYPITDGGDNPAGNRWNLVANPYTAALHASNAADATNNFLKVNIDAGNLDPSRAGLYFWDGAAYVEKSVDDAAFYIAPGQGFFVHAPDAGGTSVSFTEAMQTHQTGNIFLKSGTSYPEIILNLSDGTNNSLTKLRYIKHKTTGLDIGSDIGTFTGTSSNLKISTHLINDSQGIDFAIQALPDNNYENMIISVGVSANAGKEITFTAEGLNLPTGIKIFLEDRIANTFTRLDEANSVYTITTTEKLSGIGRFYLHTTNSALNVDENVVLDNVNIYKLDKSTLRIAGLLEQKTTVSIFNILGKQVLNTSFTTNGVKDINLPNFSKGVYLVQVKTNSGNLTKKIILE